MGLHLLFRGHLPVRSILALLLTYTNGSNDSAIILHLPMLLHIVARTPVLKPLVGHQKECQKFEQEDAVFSAALIRRCLTN